VVTNPYRFCRQYGCFTPACLSKNYYYNCVVVSKGSQALTSTFVATIHHNISAMKKPGFLLIILFATYIKAANAQQGYNAGNLVVFKIGSSTTDTLSSAAFPVSLDEYNVTGNFVRNHPMPVVINGLNKRLVSSGSATTEGQIALSVDKKYLLVPGYDTFPDRNRLSISGSNAAVINRVVAVTGNDGQINTTTAISNSFSGNSFRSVASTNGNNLWLAGTASQSAQAGVRYCALGADTALRVVRNWPSAATAPTNIRVVRIFNGQLYCTTGSGTFRGVCRVGTGTPADTGNVITLLPGFPTATNNDPYAFEFKPGSFDVIYIADGRTAAMGGGIQKWVLNTQTNLWELAYTLNEGLVSGARGLAVDWSNNTPDIYAITADSYVRNLPGNKLIKVTDTDSAAAFTVLATADTNYMFRSVAWAPEPTASTLQYVFTGNGNWSVASNWTNNTIPPAMLPSGSEIIIDHQAGGQCVLNVSQNITAGARLTINTGKNLVVPGQLTVQ
jgi:hypothetical protein